MKHKCGQKLHKNLTSRLDTYQMALALVCDEYDSNPGYWLKLARRLRRSLKSTRLITLSELQKKYGLEK